MVKKFKSVSILLCTSLVTAALIGCSNQSDSNYKHLTNAAKDGEGIYTDLGDYVIEIADYKDADFDAASKAIEEKYGIVAGACTACAKLDSKGNVLIGRNLDNQVSQCPAFFIHSSQGKYETLSLRYMNSEKYTYEEFKESGYKDSEFLNSISFCVTDSMNSEGLYMEANVREPYPEFVNKGNNPDKTTVYAPMIVAMVTRNCATVREALEYMKNEINIVSTPYYNNTIPTQYGYYIADATGEFGIIEVIADEVYYLPYTSAQGNYYLTPKWAAVENNGTGYGRVQAALDGLAEVDTMEAMLAHMEQPMWKNSVLYMNNAYLDENGRACFVDDEGNPSIDFRSDFSNSIALDENYNVTDSDDYECKARSDARWMMDDKNFEVVKKSICGVVDAMNWKDKLLRYYEGDEEDLRNDGQVFTTGASFAVSPSEKKMLIKLFEKEDLTYEITM